jgi:hypothetical protein
MVCTIPNINTKNGKIEIIQPNPIDHDGYGKVPYCTDLCCTTINIQRNYKILNPI